jgi:RNA polymerase sigma-70 factor (ECF subfamily)
MGAAERDRSPRGLLSWRETGPSRAAAPRVTSEAADPSSGKRGRDNMPETSGLGESMQDIGGLADGFESHRGHLRALAYRMLGSAAEADDAVQEAWLRLTRTAAGEIANLGGWLTTVTARICLDMLRARKARPDAPWDDALPEGDRAESGRGPEAFPAAGPEAGPERELLLAEAMGPALLLVLDLLAPAERVAFVLHDLFAIPFEDVAAVLDRSPEAARQLASRARRRIQARDGLSPAEDRARSRRVVEAFLAASRAGDFGALLAALHPDAVLRADALAVQVASARRHAGAPDLAPEIRGARAVAEALRGKAQGAQPALIDGEPGAVWAQGGKVRSVFAFTIRDGRIAAIDLVMEPARLGALQVQIQTGLL